jgi:ribosomal peptide maturation radical SAM protein 1
VFAVMPFADVGRPAIGVSLLKSAVRDAGYSSTVVYGSVGLADRMGLERYQQVSSGFAPDLLVGEWFFADDVFGVEIPPAEDYVEHLLAKYATPETIASLVAARSKRDEYLADVTETIARLEPRIVGFTTTFHQTCASLAVARRLKSLRSPPLIVFGGANCEGEMGAELLHSFPWIDVVACGEADGTIVPLLDHLLRGAPAPAEGFVWRTGSGETTRSSLVRDLDSLPYPDYDDYFEQLDRSAIGRDAAYHVIVETSRGCWWGAKHHCTFCGLNGETMTFRSKSPERAYEEIVALCRRHGKSRVGCVDNILDMRYIDTLFPMLRLSGLELELFYEVKANLRYDQLAKMHRGGLRQIQPGIESFSDEVLKLMDKGVSGVQNIQLMRWCRELGIDCAWNLLGGFPGEPPSEYAAMAELIPLLTHLDPPCSCAELRLDRFSPFHGRADGFGFRKVRPSRAYFYVFPLGRRELARLAYFFDFDYADGRRPNDYLEPVQRAVERWWKSRSAPTPVRLDADVGDPDAIDVIDTRDIAVRSSHRLTGLRARLFRCCDVATTPRAILRQSDFAGREADVESALASLVADRLVARRGEMHVTLAVFRNRGDATVGAAERQVTYV